MPVGVTSHFHFFEVNRALRFDRAAAWGMRLAIAGRHEGRASSPGEPREVRLMPFGGARVDARPRRARRRPARRARRARRGARARPRAGVPRCLTASRLGDSDLWLVPEADEAGGPDAILPGFGNTMRDGLGVRAERGGVELAIVGGLRARPRARRARTTSIGIRDGRVVGVGRAGNPDTMDGIEVVLDTGTAVSTRPG